jgi:HAD superfamily hydrolase (TIGR01509 family)
MSGPGVLLFDFGGTLDADGLHWAPRFYAAYRACGGAVEYSAFELIFRASDRALEVQPRVRTLGFGAHIEAQAQLLRDRLPDGAGIDAARLAARFHAEAVAVVARNRPILERLSARYRLGVVSNFTGNLEPCLRELDLRRYFTVVADSAVVGIAKPDPRIFAGALTQLDASAARAWMVGDNFETDIRPAGALGMRTCWLAPLEQPVPEGAAPTLRIARLPDLEGALRSDVAAAARCTG